MLSIECWSFLWMPSSWPHCNRHVLHFRGSDILFKTEQLDEYNGRKKCDWTLIVRPKVVLQLVFVLLVDHLRVIAVVPDQHTPQFSVFCWSPFLNSIRLLNRRSLRLSNCEMLGLYLASHSEVVRFDVNIMLRLLVTLLLGWNWLPKTLKTQQL